MCKNLNYFDSIKQCYLIAEIGVNHNGSMELAKSMINAAKESGANAAKFQTFTAESLVSEGTPKVKYQENNTKQMESHYDMIKKLELTHENHKILAKHCQNLKIDFISTPYDIDSARFLHEELDVHLFKTASADLVDLTLHKWIAKTGKPCIMSVGMATLGEIEETVNIYKELNNNNIILLHCVSNYPCSDESINLKVLGTLKHAFQCPVGYSDHSIGYEAAVLSLAYNACIIEKHFTLDKNLPGPDHKASSTPDEFKQLAIAIRRSEKMIGNPIKQCQQEEIQMSHVSRKSIMSSRGIKAGEVFEYSNLTLKRPGTGLSSKYLNHFIGKKATIDLPAHTCIKFSHAS